MTGEPPPGDQLPELIAQAARPAEGARRQQAKALAAMVPVLTRSARQAGFRAVAAGRWLTDTVVELTPMITVRDGATLRRQHAGMTTDQLANKLIATATKATAAVGGAAGSLAAVEFTAPPALLAAPVQIAAETLVVIAIEVKLVAELHEIYGQAVPGGMRVAAPAYLSSWVHRDVAQSGQRAGVAGFFTGAARHQLRRRVSARAARSATSVAPFMAGAAIGAEVNRRATRELGLRLKDQLRTLDHRRADIVI